MAMARVCTTTPYWASRSLLPRRIVPFCCKAILIVSARDNGRFNHEGIAFVGESLAKQDREGEPRSKSATNKSAWCPDIWGRRAESTSERELRGPRIPFFNLPIFICKPGKR